MVKGKKQQVFEAVGGEGVGEWGQVGGDRTAGREARGAAGAGSRSSSGSVSVGVGVGVSVAHVRYVSWRHRHSTTPSTGRAWKYTTSKRLGE